jgi:hypothetical protein
MTRIRFVRSEAVQPPSQPGASGLPRVLTLVSTYHERDGEIRAEYAGGDVVRGRLVGTREGDRLDFRYVQLKLDGTTSSGHCVSEVTELPDGRVRLAETWEWESQPGSGTSLVEEVAEVEQMGVQ